MWGKARLVLWFTVSIALLGMSAQAKQVQIGIVADGPWSYNELYLSHFDREIQELLGDEFDVSINRKHLLISKWTKESIATNLQKLHKDPSVDIVLALGIVASHLAAKSKPLPKPTFAPFIIDPALQKLPKKGGASGVKNLSYTTTLAGMTFELQKFHQMVGFKSVTVLVSPLFARTIPGLSQFFVRIAKAQKFKITVQEVEKSAAATLVKIPKDSQAIYFGPILDMSDREWGLLIKGVNQKKLPSFTNMGRTAVEEGVLAGITTDSEHTRLMRLARRISLFIQRTLLGEDPGTFPTDIRGPERVLINMGTAVAIGFHAKWDVLRQAEIIQTGSNNSKRVLSFKGVLEEALRANLDLLSRRATTEADRAAVGIARSRLFPQLGVSVTGRQIDKDRAEASFGSQPEKLLTAGVEVTQLLYSDKVNAGLSIEKYRAKISQAEQDQLKMDILLAAAKAYLNVLKAGYFEQIQENNLRLTRSNLDLSRLRKRVGTTGPAEVYRWQSELAKAEKSVIESRAQVSIAKIQLNRLLNRPLEERFETLEVNLTDPDFIFGDRRLFSYIENAWEFEIFRNFNVAEGFRNSPELQAVEQGIRAEQRALTMANRSFWLPNIALQGSYSYNLAQGGAGASGSGISIPNLTLPQADKENWSLGVKLSLPLFSGTERIYERKKASRSLKSLKIKKRSIRQKVEQRVRSALHKARSSYAGILLSRTSAKSARKNFQLVKNAYARGTVGITALLDAQNAALVADQVASVAVYDFLLDAMEVQRAIGKYDVFLSANQKNEYIQRLKTYFEKSKLRPPKKEK